MTMSIVSIIQLIEWPKIGILQIDLIFFQDWDTANRFDFFLIFFPQINSIEIT